MKKLFLLIPVLAIATTFVCATPTITIDGDKSDWAEVPMLSQPGTWPMLKVISASDASMGENAFAFLLENNVAFTSDWSKYPGTYLDKDYSIETNPYNSSWIYTGMGIDYAFTTGASVHDEWVSFPKGKSEDYKAIELAVPSSYVTDLGTKFGIGMYYGTGSAQEWFIPAMSGNEVNPSIGYLYKSRSYTTIPGTLTAANAFAHQSIGECTDYVDFGLRDNGNDTARWAAFPFELTEPAKFDLTVNVSSNNSWSFEFWVVDVATNEVVKHIDNSGDISSSMKVKKMGVLDLSSVPAGKYMLKVKNKTRYSKVKLYKIILTLQNGAVSNIPCTLVPVNATMATATSIDAMGDVDTIRFNSPILDQWVKWSIHVDREAYYNFKVNTYNKYGHNYKISILNSDESLVDAIQEKEGEGVNYTAGYVPVSMKKKLAAGNYFIKVQNLVNADGFRITNVVATYEGGATIAVPDTLKPIDAIKSDYAFVNGDGEFRFTDDDHDGYVTSQWGKWNIHVSKGGQYNFTLYANSTNSHHYYLSILNSDESEIVKYTLDGSSGKALTATTANRELAAGDYIIKIENFTSNSHGRVIKIIANYEGGAVTAIPGQLLGEDALLYKSGSKYMIRTEYGYLQSSNNSAPTSEWVVWNITATAGTMEVTLNLDPVTSSGHNYRVELYDGEVLKDYAEELASSGLSDAVHSKGDVTLEKTLVIPADGSYTVKLINRTQYSSMILEGITIATYVAPAGVSMTDTDTDIAAWEENFEGDACDVQLNRTILGGMYNTICLPFPVNSTMCKAIFGNDVELYTLGTATISGDILNLQFDEVSDIYQGTPVLIKTSTDIVNPLFEGVTVRTKSADCTNGGAVTFRGTFVSKDFHNGDQVLLLVANNMLSYPLSDRTLKGFRAYFEVNNPQASAPIRGARIIAGQNVVTSIDLVEAQTEGVTKVIENGQLIIIRDGVRHNTLGVQVQ